MDIAAIYEHGTIYADDHLAISYGIKHRNRFGSLISTRPTTNEDPVDEYRLTYELNDSSPARQRYLKRMHDRKHPNQPVLFGDMFAPAIEVN
jgi:hypothetical protein